MNDTHYPAVLKSIYATDVIIRVRSSLFEGTNKEEIRHYGEAFAEDQYYCKR
ncbi:MAG: hypothetical protein WAM14_24545 [Candidatus Nitrosopolaris sp.]